MSFWIDKTANPKRKYRFRIEIAIAGAWRGDPIIWYAKSCTAPSAEVSSVEHMFSDHVFNFPGRAKWGDVEMVLVDPEGEVGSTANNSPVENFSLLLTQFGYDPPAEGKTAAEYKTIARNTIAGGRVSIIAQDDEGNDLETWQLHNAFPISFKYGDFDYGADDLREFNITWKYDYAEMTHANSTNTYFKP